MHKPKWKFGSSSMQSTSMGICDALRSTKMAIALYWFISIVSKYLTITVES